MDDLKIVGGKIDPGAQHYIAGPMTGYKDFNYPAFETAAKRLSKLGMLVVSPTWHDEIVSGRAGDHRYQDYLRLGFRMLLQCDGIVMLPGWTKSLGARRELEIALDLNYPAWQLTETMLVSMEDLL
jgi:hypothetical protein